MSHRYSTTSSELTDTGCVRKVNEDSCYSDDGAGVWLVADGMGGHQAGDFASQAIAYNISSIGIPVSKEDLKQRLVERVYHANHQILQHASRHRLGAIGSTLVALMIHENWYCGLWSGDSRLYILRDNILRRVSRDHTEVQALLDQRSITPEQALTWPRRNVITHAIGVSDIPIFETREGTLQNDDRFLLCSDGLTEYLTDQELEGFLIQRDTTQDALCAAMVSTAVERGGKDNVTVVMVDCHPKAADEFNVSGVFPEFGGLL